VIQLDAPSVLLQWSTGGLLFLWVTTRHRLLGAGYGWLLRSSYAILAAMAFAIGLKFDFLPGRDLPALGVAVAATAVTVESFRLRHTGVDPTAAVVPLEAAAAEITPIKFGAVSASARSEAGRGAVSGSARSRATGVAVVDADKAQAKAFDPRLDLIAPAIGLVGLIVAGINAGDPAWLSVSRMLVGAAFLGVVTDSMLLGHWYLVQPGLSREPLVELVRWVGGLWLPEVALLLVPVGMVSVWTGTIDDGYAGMLGWFWAACVVTTIGLVFVTLAALRERQYAAVMAATGLLYLAILTGFGIDLVARASLA